MTDYFALLEQPRRPWLDAEELKEVFHARARNAQPEAELNEAYQVLRDPKRRLHHLLALSDAPPSARDSNVPREIEALFPTVADLIREADAVIGKLQSASSVLGRSLFRTESLQLEEKIDGTLRAISHLLEEALVRLKAVAANDLAGMHALYLHFSYLSRWQSELAEKKLLLSI